MSISEDLVPSNFKRQSQIVTLDFNGLFHASSKPPLQLQTKEELCGGQLWPAGMILAEYLLRHKLGELEYKSMFVRSEPLLVI